MRTICDWFEWGKYNRNSNNNNRQVCRYYNEIHSLKMRYLFDLHEKFGVKCVTNVLSNRMSVKRRNIEIQSAVELVRLPQYKEHNNFNNNKLENRMTHFSTLFVLPFNNHFLIRVYRFGQETQNTINNIHKFCIHTFFIPRSLMMVIHFIKPT